MKKTPMHTQEAIKLIDTARTVRLAVSRVKRHPRLQRVAQPARWIRKAAGGAFNPILAQAEPLHAVPDGNGGLWILDGGHRVEACQGAAEFGMKTVLEFKVYGPASEPPSDEQCAALLVVLSDRHHLQHSYEQQFTWALQAGDALAQAVAVQLDRIPKTRVIVSAWNVATKQGIGRLTAIVNFIVDVWGDDVDATGLMFTTLETMDLGDLMSRRRRVIMKHAPRELLHQADHMMLRVIGKREPKSHYLRQILVGRGGE